MVLAAFTLLGLFYASRTYLLYNSYPDNSITWKEAMLPALADWYLWALFFPLLAWLAIRFPIERGVLGRRVATHLAGGALVAVARVLLDVGVVRPLLDLRSVPMDRAMWTSFHPNLLTYAALVGLVHAVLFYERSRDRELRSSQLEARLAEAQLRALRSQLHPHFLFNTLHAIGTLMHRDVEAAERMLARLGDLLRVVIEQAPGDEVPLEQEIEFLERYLEIERIRFADRLEFRLAAPTETLDLAVPHLLLQPLVENAIRHGIAPRAGRGRVEVIVTRRENRLEIVVRDDGRGLAPAMAEQRTGVGIANARARLAQLYGEDQLLELREPPTGGVEVFVSLPVREAAVASGDPPSGAEA